MDNRSKFLQFKVPPKSKKLSLRDFRIQDPVASPPPPPPPPPKDPFIFVDDFAREDAICKIESWAKKPLKSLVVLGHTGSGKSTTIEYYLRKHGHKFDYYEDDYDMDDFLSCSSLNKKGPGIIEDPELIESKSKIEAALKTERKLILVSTDYFMTTDILKKWAKMCIVVKIEMPSKPFIIKVLRTICKTGTTYTTDTTDTTVISGGINDTLLTDIANNCNLNISTAIHSLQWSMLMASSSNPLLMDAPLDVPKAVRLAFQGQKVQCLGGSSDIDFYSRMIQCTVPDTNNLNQVSRALEHLSHFDTVSEVLDSDSKWSLLQMIPLKAQKPFEVLWPKKKSNLKMVYQ